MVGVLVMVNMLHVCVNLDVQEQHVISLLHVTRHVTMDHVRISLSFPNVSVKMAGLESRVMFLLLLPVPLDVSMVDVSLMVHIVHVCVNLDGQDQHVISRQLLVNRNVLMVDV